MTVKTRRETKETIMTIRDALINLVNEDDYYFEGKISAVCDILNSLIIEIDEWGISMIDE